MKVVIFGFLVAAGVLVAAAPLEEEDKTQLLLTPWLMEPGGSMAHSQGLSNNSYPEPNQPNSPH